MKPYDVVIVGGGIVGLATAREILRRTPGTRLALLEKENRWAAHQTGRNSGVIHSGIYYRPGSLKARFATAGSRSIAAYAERRGIPYEICGKVIVATRTDELDRLEALYRRGLDNGLEVRRLDAAEVREHEPHVRSVGGIHVPSTGIVDYAAVCRALADEAEAAGADLRLETRVRDLTPRADAVVVETDRGTFEARQLINCAGLHSDRLARLGGADSGARIVPFRGEYYELVPAKRHLVRNLIYPVPNPDFPFLGVHFTRMIDGAVHAGPNAVLALAREGYRKRDLALRDAVDTLSYRGFWRLALANVGEGVKEMVRSWSKTAFVASLRRLIPEIEADDVVPSPAGVRAQALTPDGKLVDDFLIVREGRALHVCNAPSPAATSSLEIAAEIVDRMTPVDRAPSVAPSVPNLLPSSPKNTKVNA